MDATVFIDRIVPNTAGGVEDPVNPGTFCIGGLATGDSDGVECDYCHKLTNPDDSEHLGVAVDTEAGLIVPVVKDVDRQPIIAIAGQIAEPLCLGGDRLLCLYVHRHDPPGMRVVLSHDRGRTWDLDAELVVYDATAGQEAGMIGTGVRT